MTTVLKVRFNQPIFMEGMPEEASQEWEGLITDFTTKARFGYVGPDQKRFWDDENKVWNFWEGRPCNPEKVADELRSKFVFVDNVSLQSGCECIEGKRPYLLEWLKSGGGSKFVTFFVDPEVVDLVKVNL